MVHLMTVGYEWQSLDSVVSNSYAAGAGHGVNVVREQLAAEMQESSEFPLERLGRGAASLGWRGREASLTDCLNHHI